MIISPTLLMAQSLGRASQRYEMFPHDPEVVGSNPSRVELGVRSSSLYLSPIWAKNITIAKTHWQLVVIWL